MKAAKKLSLMVSLLIFFLLSNPISAQQYVGMQSGSLQISAQQGRQFDLEISGAIFLQEQVDGGYLLANLHPGDYTLRISIQGRGRYPTHPIHQIVQVRPGQRTHIQIYANNQIATSYSLDRNATMLYTMQIVQPAPPVVQPTPPVHHTPPAPQIRPMSSRDFSDLEREVQEESFSSDKLKLLRNASEYHRFTSDQLGRLLKLFSHDSDRLKCAQIIVPRIVDPENLYLQAGQFSFSSTKNEYLDLIRR